MDIQDVTFDEATETYQRARLDAIRAWGAERQLPGPVQIEIGSNQGRFLKGLARLYTDRSVLGIEIRRRFVEVLSEELTDEGLTNAQALAADANLALPLLFADNTVERIYILFPDPWWKKRHAKRRLFTPEFLGLLANKLRPDGLLVIKTDVEPYAEIVSELIDQSQRWRRVMPDDPAWPEDEDQWPKTTREGKILRKGLPVWKIYAEPTGELQEVDGLEVPMERFAKPEVTIDRSRGRRPRLRK